MAWALPDIQELSKEQERARLLPKEGCYLIVGGPGTGKSVLALLRTRRHHRPKGAQDYVFLVYNRLLLEASRELVDGAVNAHPWKAWFKRTYKWMLARPCPTKGQPYFLDWERIRAAIDSAPGEIAPPLTPFVIIDEGQDMPPAFYHALAQLGFEGFYVVADQNQQITEENSNLRDIENALAIETRDRIELTENYRNCDRVARLALAFCVDDPASPPVNLPTGRPCARTPVLVDYGSGCRLDFASVVQRLLKLADRDPDRLIGVITPNDACRQRWLDALKAEPVALDHGRPRIVTYAAGEDDEDHGFSRGGVFVINAQSAKGLEFDTVFLADIDEYPCHLEDPVWMDGLKRLFYVMVSRACEQVILLRQSGRSCPIAAILPRDESVLRRWR
jgi:DNA helicase-2/ATP-dependent DNA helicase PcrA